MLKDKSLTYVTLFSSAGVGCHGFQMEGYHCIATNEIIERRMQVQRCNHKCEFDSGYIVGDITSDEIKQRIYDEIHRWEKKEMIVWTLSLLRHPVRASASLTIKRTVRK